MRENDIKPIGYMCESGIGHVPQLHLGTIPEFVALTSSTSLIYDQSAIDRLTTQLKHYRMAAEAEADLADERGRAIKRLTAERDAAVADAERYRMLRNADPDADGLHIVDTGLDTWGNHYSEYLVEDEADSEIDSAMKEQEQGK